MQWPRASATQALALTFALSATAAGAHPHIWIESRSEIVFDDVGTIRAVRHNWTFDEMYSAYASQGLDTNGDGHLSAEELQPVTDANIESLAQYAYFTFLKTIADGVVESRFAAPVDASTEHDGSQLMLHFTLPLETPVDPKATDTFIDVFDPAYFVGFSLAEDAPVRLVAAPEGCKPRIGRAKKLGREIAAKLAQIPATGTVPSDLLSVVGGNANTIQVICK